jgi:hypothetical protein
MHCPWVQGDGTNAYHYNNSSYISKSYTTIQEDIYTQNIYIYKCDIDRHTSFPYFVHACMVVDMAASCIAWLLALSLSLSIGINININGRYTR